MEDRGGSRGILWLVAGCSGSRDIFAISGEEEMLSKSHGSFKDKDDKRE